MFWWYCVKLYKFPEFIYVYLRISWDLNRIDRKITGNLDYKEGWFDLSWAALSKEMNENLNKNQSLNCIFHCFCLLLECFTIDVCWKLSRNGLFHYWLKCLVIEFSTFFWDKHWRIIDDTKDSVTRVTHWDYKRIRKVYKNLYRLFIPLFKF